MLTCQLQTAACNLLHTVTLALPRSPCRLQAERQFGQLLAMVEARLQQASQDALLRQQLRQNQQHQNQNQDHQQGRSAADAPQAGGEA